MVICLLKYTFHPADDPEPLTLNPPSIAVDPMLVTLYTHHLAVAPVYLTLHTQHLIDAPTSEEGCNGRAFDLRSKGRGFKARLGAIT